VVEGAVVGAVDDFLRAVGVGVSLVGSLSGL
jgi:hypothetical protein